MVMISIMVVAAGGSSDRIMYLLWKVAMMKMRHIIKMIDNNHSL